MNHNGKKARKLLAEHFEARRVGVVMKYFPITDDANDHWVHTGVCRACNTRAISVGVCRQCGEDHR